MTLVLDLLPGVALSGFWAGGGDRDRAGGDLDPGLERPGLRRRRLVRPVDGPPGPRRAGQSPIEDDVPGHGVRAARRAGPSVLDRALRSGDVPTLHRWLADGRYRLVGWETGLVVADRREPVRHPPRVRRRHARVPLGRQGHGQDRRLEPPGSRRRRSRSATPTDEGLLAHDGSSYGNLFSGDAERAALTMSNVTKKKEGRLGAGLHRVLLPPPTGGCGPSSRSWPRSLGSARRPATSADGASSRACSRGWTYALLRSFTTVVSRDVCVNGVLNDVCEGRAAIYVDLLGYDEVSHHSGPERVRHDGGAAGPRSSDRSHRAGLAVGAPPVPPGGPLRPRPDPGRDLQGAHGRDPRRLRRPALRRRRPPAIPTPRRGARSPRRGCARREGTDDELSTPSTSAAPIVLASGNLGLVTLPGEPRRLTRDEIDARHPTLIRGLLANPEVGFVLVARPSGGSIVLGAGGSRTPRRRRDRRGRSPRSVRPAARSTRCERSTPTRRPPT